MKDVHKRRVFWMTPSSPRILGLGNRNAFVTLCHTHQRTKTSLEVAWCGEIYVFLPGQLFQKHLE